MILYIIGNVISRTPLNSFCSTNRKFKDGFMRVFKSKTTACVSDRVLLTLHSGGGGGKSSTSMLAALQHKLFSRQYEGGRLHRQAFLKEKDKYQKWQTSWVYTCMLCFQKECKNGVHFNRLAHVVWYILAAESPITLVNPCCTGALWQ